MKKSSRKPRALEPELHKTFVESCLYQPTEESGNRRYGFRFIAHSMQKKLQSLFIQVFESDLIFNKTNKAYRSERQEPKAWTQWYRQMGETFCQEGWWDTLRQHAKSAEAVDAINRLQRHHQPHALFAHHTTESLLFVGQRVLPPLQRQCRRAERTFQRWSKVFFWLPDAFKTHYKQYLATLRASVNALQSGVTLSLQHRLTLAEQSPDGKTDDVLFSLIGQLRQEVPNFLSDEQLVQVLESPSSTNDAFMRAFDKKFLLPTKRRQSTFQAQAECVAFLHEHTESRAWINTWLNEKRHSSSAIKLHMIKHNTHLMLLPEAWLEQNQKSTSFKKIRQQQPWLRHWTLSHSMQCLRAQCALERLTPAQGENPFSANANTALLFDDFDSVTEAQKMLKTYQETLKNFPVKSSFAWWPFSKKHILQKTRLEKTRTKIDEQLQSLENVKMAWVLTSAPQWEETIHTMSENTVLAILRYAEKVALPSYGKKELNTKAALQHCYQRLSICCAEVLSKKPLSPGLPREITLYAHLEHLVNAKPLLASDWESMQAYKRFLDKNPQLATLWQEKTTDVIARLEQQWLLAVKFWCQSRQDASMTHEMVPAARIHLIQATQSLQAWSPAFHQRETTKKAFHALWQCYLEQGKIQSENNANRIDLLESILIYGQGEFAERAKALRAVRIQKDKLEDFKAQCEAASQQSHEVSEKNESGESPSKNGSSSQQSSPVHLQSSHSRPFFAQAPSTTTPPTTPPLFDPTPFIAIFEQALTNQGRPPLPVEVAQVLLSKVSKTMSEFNVEDVATWHSNRVLAPNLRAILDLDNTYQKSTITGFKNSLLGRKTKGPRFMIERRELINMAAKVYRIAKLPETEQSDALLALQSQLSRLQQNAYTPHVPALCGTLVNLITQTLHVLPPPIYQPETPVM